MPSQKTKKKMLSKEDDNKNRNAKIKGRPNQGRTPLHWVVKGTGRKLMSCLARIFGAIEEELEIWEKKNYHLLNIQKRTLLVWDIIPSRVKRNTVSISAKGKKVVEGHRCW